EDAWPSEVRPVTPSVPATVVLPVNVDAPVTPRVPPTVVLPVSVLAPVTDSVPPVLIFVLIVVAALTTKKTNRKDKIADKETTKKLLLPKIFNTFI
ncbi:hypothetical protein COV42_00910, partial [Candidatus Campbellbacteria bacterium CG11_big_fil_rev_8_21_14_0_20_44_21]